MGTWVRGETKAEDYDPGPESIDSVVNHTINEDDLRQVGVTWIVDRRKKLQFACGHLSEVGNLHARQNDRLLTSVILPCY